MKIFGGIFGKEPKHEPPHDSGARVIFFRKSGSNMHDIGRSCTRCTILGYRDVGRYLVLWPDGKTSTVHPKNLMTI